MIWGLIIGTGVYLVLLRFAYEVGKQDGHSIGYREGYWKRHSEEGRR
ncbi:hypothetical protein MHZ92_14565 [Sporosarcina sp. ACRSL]|nr:hypothetical protein [Sporosarcina sp. ACRSL]MCG7345359.1 hypothetical protein [Sporosarcina sp. ACRSL]